MISVRILGVGPFWGAGRALGRPAPAPRELVAALGVGSCTLVPWGQGRTLPRSVPLHSPHVGGVVLQSQPAAGLPVWGSSRA